MNLSFQGWSRTCNSKLPIVQFAIADPPGCDRVGQPVTVSAQLSET